MSGFGDATPATPPSSSTQQPTKVALTGREPVPSILTITVRAVERVVDDAAQFPMLPRLIIEHLAFSPFVLWLFHEWVQCRIATPGRRPGAVHVLD